jgi:hypothetical protein
MSRTKLALMAAALLGVGIFTSHANAGMSTGTWRYFPYGVPDTGYYGGDGYYGRYRHYGYDDRYRYRHWRRYHHREYDDED